MSVAIAAATALLYFSSQVIVHAAAAFEAAFVFTSVSFSGLLSDWPEDLARGSRTCSRGQGVLPS